MVQPDLPPLAIANSGIAFWRKPPGDVILIVTGLTRSQTTRAFRLLSSLSTIRAFDGGNFVTREDDRFFEQIEQGDVAAARVNASRRGPGWTVKRPRIYRHADTLRAVCGPRLAWLFVVRDWAAVAYGEWLANGGEVEDWIQRIATETAELATFALASPEPKAILSAEKLCLHPLQIQHLLQDWLGEPRTYGAV
jgi:hypothetical protein